MSAAIQPRDAIPLPFRIRQFDYNRYRINHTTIQGILHLANIVTNVGQIPQNLIPPEQLQIDDLPVGVGYQAIVAFTNQGEKHQPSQQLPTPQETVRARKFDLSGYITNEENYEPWNEYVLIGNPPKLLRTRTILARVEWVIDVYNSLGDPYLWVNHNTTHVVANTETPERGMT